MKKILFFSLFIFIAGCSIKQEELEKDKAFLKNPNLMYDRVILSWNEPIEIRFLNTEKFIAVWQRGDGIGSIYNIRVLFYKYKVMGYSIEEINIDKIIAKELTISTNSKD